MSSSYRSLVPYGPPSAFRRQPQAERNEAIVENFANYHSSSTTENDHQMETERKIALIELKIELVQLRKNLQSSSSSYEEDERLKMEHKIRYYSEKMEETKKVLLQMKEVKEIGKFVEQVEKEEDIQVLKDMITQLTQQKFKNDCALN
nr:unnamed protein product [Naegleria fowleri]